ncbi:MAG: tyrosine-type recombinase/integrase [Gemmatimonadota bacterium]
MLRPGLRLSWAFDRADDARDYEATLRAVRKAKRNDLIDFLATSPERLPVLHAALRTAGVASVRVEDLAPPPEVLTIGALADEFSEYMRQPGSRSRFKRAFAKTTAAAYRAHIERFIAWLEDGRATPAASITEGTLAAYHRHRVNADGLSPVGADRATTPIQALFSWACDSQRRDAGPVPNLRPLRFSKSGKSAAEAKALTPAELAAIRSELEPEHWPVFETTLALGLRITECLFLRVSDIDLGAKVVHIRPHPDRPLKTRSSQREVPIPGFALPMLRRAVAHASGEHLWPEHWRAKGPSDSADAWRAGYHRLAKKWAQACKAAGVEATIHSLRHTYGSRLADAGVAPRDIAHLMGHESVSTTERYWGRKDLRERKALAVKQVSDLLRPAPVVPPTRGNRGRTKSTKDQSLATPQRKRSNRKSA